MQNEQENEQENNLEPEEGQQDYQNVFSKNALEFATVAREFCVFAENATQYSKADFLLVASRLVPLLYMKAALLPETSIPHASRRRLGRSGGLLHLRHHTPRH